MAKSEKTRIEFDANGKHYKLEYTLNVLKKLDRDGYGLEKLRDMVFTAPEVLFRYAFYANHPTETKAVIHELFKSLKRSAEDMPVEYDDEGRPVDALMSTIGDMITEAVEELSNRGTQGNVAWKVTK